MSLATIITLALLAGQGGQHGSKVVPAVTAKVDISHVTPLEGAYNPATVIDFEGKIIGCQVYTPPRASQPFVDILVRLDNTGTALVELGPQSIVESTRLNMYLGDTIWVKGSKVTVRGDSSVLAQTVRHQGSSVCFRRPDGTPFWRG